MSCKGLHCPGCGDGGGAELVVAAIVVIVVIGSGAAARAADSLLHAVETLAIIAGITLGSVTVLGLGGWLGGRALLRARARARSSLPAVQTLRAVTVLRPIAELPRPAEPLGRAIDQAGDVVPVDRIGR